MSASARVSSTPSRFANASLAWTLIKPSASYSSKRSEKVGSRLISELAKFMQIHSFEEIQDLAESGELDKHLPLVPSSRSVTLGDFDKIETFDRRRFDSEAFDRYLGSLGG